MQDAFLGLATGGEVGIERTGWPQYVSIASGQVREFGAQSAAAMGQVVGDIMVEQFEAMCPQLNQPA